MAMKRFSRGLLLLTLGVAVPAGDVLACGDKFLVIGRGTRRIQTARHRASILLVLPPDTGLAAAAREMKLEATLKQAGHTVETLTAPAKMSASLAARRYDFVIAGAAAAAMVVRDSSGVTPAPTVIPLVLKTDTPAAGGTVEPSSLAIEAPTRSLAYLSAIDSEMGRRQATAPRP